MEKGRKNFETEMIKDLQIPDTRTDGITKNINIKVGTNTHSPRNAIVDKTTVDVSFVKGFRPWIKLSEEM